jgi:hypothetical protein
VARFFLIFLSVVSRDDLTVYKRYPNATVQSQKGERKKMQIRKNTTLSTITLATFMTKASILVFAKFFQFWQNIIY